MKIKMNFHGDKYIQQGVEKHYEESLNHIETLYNNVDSENFPEKSKYTEDLLLNVQSDIIGRSIINELERKGSI